jgi:hypothetical protein
MDYKELLIKYMQYLIEREGSCYVCYSGPTAYYGEADHMTYEERQELAKIFKEDIQKI